MSKTMGVSPITDTIYYGTVKNDMWQGKREDVTDMAIKAVFEWFIHKMEKECQDGAYQIRFPSVPYVLEMRKDNGWILCSERLPEKKEKRFGNKQKRTEVLVTLRNGLVKEMTFEFATKEFWEAGDENQIEQWAKEHQIVTNAMKFKQVFGIEPETRACVIPPKRCENCEYYIPDDIECRVQAKFWNAEYKPKKKGEE